MRYRLNTLLILFIFIAFYSLLYPTAALTDDSPIPKYVVPPPPFSEGIFPCSQCHAEMEPDSTRRELGFHTEITEIFNHAKQQRWCLDCHNHSDRDKLRLANGDLVSFEESYNLCGQCHGTIFRDWKAGIHGKRTGMWNGKKLYRLCVHCHNPHSPRFKQLTPMPPPEKPYGINYSTTMKYKGNPLKSIRMKNKTSDKTGSNDVRKE